MARICRENGADFIVINMPLTTASVLEYGDQFFQQSQQLRELVESEGGTYYDFNLAKPQLFSACHEYYADFQHLNLAGGEAMSKAIAMLLNMRAAGQDTSQLFYTPDEWNDSIESVEFVTLEGKKVRDGVTVQAKAIKGKNVSAEYQYCVQYNGDEEWRVVQDWTDSATCTFEPDPSRSYVKVRVNVRPQGTLMPYQRYRMTGIDY